MYWSIFSRNLSTKSHIITSKIKPITIPKIGLPEFIWSKNEKYFNKIAIQSYETGRSYTYYELYKKSLGFSRFLKEKLKLNKQDTVGIVLNNIPEYPIVVLGAIHAGLKITTCNPNFTIDEIKRQFQSAQPRAIVTLDCLSEKIRKTTTSTIPLIKIFENSGFDEATIKEIDSPNYDVALNDTIMVLYSSGTTGLPKGVELTHSTIVSSLSQSSSPEIEHIKPSDGDNQDIIPLFLPIFHVYALIGIMLHGLAQGAKLFTMTTLSSNSFINIFQTYKPTVLFCTPPQLLMISNNNNIKKTDLSSLRTIYCGAAPLKASDIEHARLKTANILQIYGLTELSPLALSQSNLLEHGIKTGGSGFLIPNTSAKILDIETKQALGPNQSGELVLKGPQVMKGYFNNPEATKETFLEENWIKTGDIAHYDQDEHFFITDRLKEIIKVKGFQVAPAELEGILREHPKVDDVAVVGVPHNITGEAPKAFIVCKKNQNVTAEELKQFIAEKVTNYKHLTGGIQFVDEIPKTPSGKILRRKLKNL